ncbi:MAG: glycosyltransferase family 4 protein [bacterium]|nr:glycosyltransferase family 4 protein [bacterium]
MDNTFGIHLALVNLITQTALTRTKAPLVKSNKDAMIVSIAAALKKQGVMTDLFVSDAYRPARNEDIGVDIYYLPTKWKWVFWPSCIPFTPGLVSRLKDRYDVVVCSELFQLATVLAVIAKIISKKKMKIIVWQEMARHQRIMGQFMSKIYHSVVVRYFMDRHIDLYIPRGESAKQFLLSQGIKVEKISDIIPHGINPAKFYCDPAVMKERYIFSPSRLVYSKGVDVLLRAFEIVSKEVPDVRLIIQGDGPQLAEYQQLAREIRIDKRVIFSTERISHDEMREKYQKALMTVICSRKDLMIFSAMESIACGTPVIISTGADSHANFLDGKGGLVFTSENYVELSKCLILFIKDETFRNNMEGMAIQKSEAFFNNKLCKMFTDAIDEQTYRNGIL